MERTRQHGAVELGLGQGRPGVRAHPLECLDRAVLGPRQDDQMGVGDHHPHSALRDRLRLADPGEHRARSEQRSKEECRDSANPARLCVLPIRRATTTVGLGNQRGVVDAPMQAEGQSCSISDVLRSRSHPGGRQLPSQTRPYRVSGLLTAFDALWKKGACTQAACRGAVGSAGSRNARGVPMIRGVGNARLVVLASIAFVVALIVRDAAAAPRAAELGPVVAEAQVRGGLCRAAQGHARAWPGRHPGHRDRRRPAAGTRRSTSPGRR